MNKGSITLTNIGSFSPYICDFTYPVASNIEVECGDVIFNFEKGDIYSSCMDLGPMEELGESVKIYPSNEDDTYIYEVTVNV